MNKAELIDAVASSTDMSKAEAGRAVDAVLGSITDSLAMVLRSQLVVLVILRSETEVQEWEEIHKLVKLFTLLQRKYLRSKLLKSFKNGC